MMLSRIWSICILPRGDLREFFALFLSEIDRGKPRCVLISSDKSSSKISSLLSNVRRLSSIILWKNLAILFSPNSTQRLDNSNGSFRSAFGEKRIVGLSKKNDPFFSVVFIKFLASKFAGHCVNFSWNNAWPINAVVEPILKFLKERHMCLRLFAVESA